MVVIVINFGISLILIGGIMYTFIQSIKRPENIAIYYKINK